MVNAQTAWIGANQIIGDCFDFRLLVRTSLLIISNLGFQIWSLTNGCYVQYRSQRDAGNVLQARTKVSPESKFPFINETIKSDEQHDGIANQRSHSDTDYSITRQQREQRDGRNYRRRDACNRAHTGMRSEERRVGKEC